jgi:hypothetical protein
MTGPLYKDDAEVMKAELQAEIKRLDVTISELRGLVETNRDMLQLLLMTRRP